MLIRLTAPKKLCPANWEVTIARAWCEALCAEVARYKAGHPQYIA